MTSAAAVTEIARVLEQRGIRIWVDGGWGVDALLAEQTRVHRDLDLVVALRDIAEARAALETLGLSVVEEELPTRLELADTDAGGRRVDLHAVTFDDEGNGWQQLQDGGRFCYPAAGLLGEGVIAGVRLACLSPELQVACHSGYPLDETDLADMEALASRFGLDLPPPA